MCESVPAASIPPGQTPGIWCMINPMGQAFQIFDNVRAPRHLQTTKNLLSNNRSSFLTALWVKGFKHHHFLIRAFIVHKCLTKAMKPFVLSFFSQSDSFHDLFYAVLLSWNSYFYHKIATNILVYIWSDGLWGQAFDHHGRNRERGICQQKMPAGLGIWPIFQMHRVCLGGAARSWNWLEHKYT